MRALTICVLPQTENHKVNIRTENNEAERKSLIFFYEKGCQFLNIYKNLFY